MNNHAANNLSPGYVKSPWFLLLVNLAILCHTILHGIDLGPVLDHLNHVDQPYSYNPLVGVSFESSIFNNTFGSTLSNIHSNNLSFSVVNYFNGNFGV